MAYLLHHLLTESAACLPDKEAVRFKGKGLTYVQPDALTNQVARELQDRPTPSAFALQSWVAYTKLGMDGTNSYRRHILP